MNFSVLLSVYKSELSEYLRHAIYSVYKSQSLKPNEIILVKDGILNDDLENCISNLLNEIPILKVYGYSINKGLGYALNFGLKKCSNEIVFRMDTDDISHNKRFEKQLSILLENNFAIVGSMIEEFKNEIGDLKKYRILPIESSSINSFKESRNPFNHMTVGFKKSKVESVGGYIGMPGYEDYYLWLRLLKKYKGYNVNENLVYARVGNNMISRRQGFIFFKNEFNFQLTIYKDGLISGRIFLLNFFRRVLARLLPKFILKVIYFNFLRR